MTAGGGTAGQRGRVLTRKDLAGNYDDDAVRLIMDMQAYGWTGELNANQHAFMYAPDGVSTVSVSRSSLRGRSGRNSRADFERWRKAHEAALEERARPNAFGLSQDDIDRAYKGIADPVNGKPIPTATIAAMKRSEKIRAWREAHPGMTLGDWTFAGIVGEDVQANPHGWFVLDNTVKPPVLIDHGSGVSEAAVWEDLAVSRPDLFGSSEPEAAVAQPATEAGESQVKVFVCTEDGCGKQFKTAGGLNLHRTGKHPVDVACKECGRVCRGQGGLGRHMLKHRPKVASEAVAEDDTTGLPQGDHGVAGDDSHGVPQGEDVLLAHLEWMPEGDEAEEMVAKIRSIVASPVVNELRTARTEISRLNEENARLAGQLADLEARYALIREAMAV